VAAGIETPAADARRRILANAEAGTTLVVDAPGPQAWWRVAGLKRLREDPDRDYYSLGKGQVVAYKEPVVDPSDLALDMIDYVTQNRRAARVFNCNSAVVDGRPGSALHHKLRAAPGPSGFGPASRRLHEGDAVAAGSRGTNGKGIAPRH
jgi:hypothetical protein